MIPSSPWSLSSSSESNRALLIRFWINAPVDQLQNLWEQSFGIETSRLVSELSTNFVFTDEQIALRNSIGTYFDENGLGGEFSHQLMLANFLLSPPGLLVINNVLHLRYLFFLHHYYQQNI